MRDKFEVVVEEHEPWKGMSQAVGEKGRVYTDRGRAVSAWRPYDDVSEQYRYWCHGHATLSYYLHGFSIFSGKDMKTVLEDEWDRIDKKPWVGDLLVFIGGKGSANPGAIVHTARFETAEFTFGGRTQFTLSSKNGWKKLRRKTDVGTVEREYKDAYWYLEDHGCCATTRIEKQYYRRKNREHRVDIEKFLTGRKKLIALEDDAYSSSEDGLLLKNKDEKRSSSSHSLFSEDSDLFSL